MCNLRVDALQVSRSYTPVAFPGKNERRVAMQIRDILNSISKMPSKHIYNCMIKPVNGWKIKKENTYKQIVKREENA